MDKIDRQILYLLQRNADLTEDELGQKIGLSKAPCWRRVRALEANGFIRGYRAEIDRHKNRLVVLSFVRFDAERTTGELMQPMEPAIRATPAICAFHYITRRRHVRL